MKKTVLMLVIVMLYGSVSFADPTAAVVTHRQLQAVNADGINTYNATDKVVIQGIVLNNPEEMLDPTPGSSGMGGQWQIFIQGEGDDHAGTAVWFGQNYSMAGYTDYTEPDYLSDLFRINRDPSTGHVFAAGDRVKVTGWYKFFGGKINVNEKHLADPFYDFTVEVIKPAVGFPQPEIITLSQVKDSRDNFLFDSSRNTGCEYYQGCLVRIEDVNIIDPENWAPNALITVRDPTGRTFPVKLGMGDGFSRYECPRGQIDLIGIMNQEDSSSPYSAGYQIWVVNYDGHGLVLTDRGHQRGNLPGDINSDFKVDFFDLAEFAENWLQIRAGLYEDGQ